MADSPDQWKQKYFDSLEQLERREQQWQKIDSVLRRSLSRLSFIGDGRDATLDQRLEELRNRVRGEKDMDRLQDLVGRITRLAEKLPGPAADAAAAGGAPGTAEVAAPVTPAAGGPGLLGRLFGRSGEASQPVPAPTPEVAPPAPVSADTSELDIATDLLRHLLSHLPEAHDDLVPLLQRKIEAAEAREELERLADQVAGLLAGDGDSERPAAEQVLLQLVERLELSAESAASTAALKNRLQQGLSESDLPAVLEQLVELVSQVRRAAEQDRQEVERFLLELTEQLGQIDQELDGVGAQGQAMIDQNRQFGERVNNDMSGLHATVESATDLAELKLLIAARMEEIHERLREHRAAEEARDRDFESSISTLKQRLQEMERHSEALQGKVEEARREAFTDALTGLANRHALEQRMAREYQRWQRYGYPMSLFLLDIDHFKKVNDTYGHPAGDKVLQVVGALLQQMTRDSDFAARYGGEEFIMLLPETDLPGATAVAEKLRTSMAAKAFHSGETRVMITASFGIAQFGLGESFEEVLQRADGALYRAKQAGRNCCQTDP